MTSNSPSNFGFGTLGQVVTSNGAGVAPSMQNISLATNLGYRSGIYYLSNYEGITNTKAAIIMTADAVYFNLWHVFAPVTINELQFDVTVLGGNVRVGIYNYASTPTTLIVDLGIVDVSGTGIKTLAISPSLTLAPGFYSIGFLNDSTTSYQTSTSSTITISSVTFGSTSGYASLGAHSNMLNTTSYPYAGGLPNDVTADSYSSASMSPIIVFKVA